MATLADACRETAPAEGKAIEIRQPRKISDIVMGAIRRKA